MSVSRRPYEREEPIKRAIVKYLNGLYGCYAHKTHGSVFSAGQPDIDACINGRALKLEVKSPTGKATKLQEAELARWKKAGAITGIVRSVEEVKEILLRETRFDIMGLQPRDK